MRSSFGQVIVRLAAEGAECCWPDCEAVSWFEIGLPLCQKHAARTYLVVGDLVPKDDELATHPTG